MKFFSQLHRSMFDPCFYREALKSSALRSVMFLLKLLFLSAFIMSLSKTYYLVHKERGIAPIVSEMFDGLEIGGGRLVITRDEPIVFSSGALAELMNRLVGYPRFFSGIPEGFLIIDTGSPTAAINNTAGIILHETAVEFREMQTFVPYAVLGGDTKFTRESVQDFLNKHAFLFAISFFMTSIFFGSMTMFLSVFFLSLAAYFFRIDRAGKYKHFVLLAIYSIPPVMLGDALVSVTGVHADWTWHVFLILSTLLIFRAMRRIAADTHSRQNNEKENAG